MTLLFFSRNGGAGPGKDDTAVNPTSGPRSPVKGGSRHLREGLVSWALLSCSLEVCRIRELDRAPLQFTPLGTEDIRLSGSRS